MDHHDHQPGGQQETYAVGVFSLGYGRIGPTEARLALIALNTVMALGAALRSTSSGWG